MEDTHGEAILEPFISGSKCLNPYYNGRYSWSGLIEFYYGIYRES